MIRQHPSSDRQKVWHDSGVITSSSTARKEQVATVVGPGRIFGLMRYFGKRADQVEVDVLPLPGFGVHNGRFGECSSTTVRGDHSPSPIAPMEEGFTFRQTAPASCPQLTRREGGYGLQRGQVLASRPSATNRSGGAARCRPAGDCTRGVQLPIDNAPVQFFDLVVKLGLPCARIRHGCAGTVGDVAGLGMIGLPVARGSPSSSPNPTCCTGVSMTGALTVMVEVAARLGQGAGAGCLPAVPARRAAARSPASRRRAGLLVVPAGYGGSDVVFAVPDEQPAFGGQRIGGHNGAGWCPGLPTGVFDGVPVAVTQVGVSSTNRVGALVPADFTQDV